MLTHELDPVTRLTADAIGEPGRRVFYLQAASGAEQVTLLLEKEQVRSLAEQVLAWLPQLAAERPEDPGDRARAEAQPLDLVEPVVPEFRVGELSLAYDPERDRVAVTASELVVPDPDQPPPEPRQVRLWVTRPQLRVLARHGAAVVARGRPPCPLCGNPLDPTGHVCPTLNGHRSIDPADGD